LSICQPSGARRQRELAQILDASRSLERGSLDHLFRDDDTKNAVRADLEQQAIELITAELKANPGLYKELPDGSWELVPDTDRKIIRFLDDK
jgi:hypothetical protein